MADVNPFAQFAPSYGKESDLARIAAGQNDPMAQSNDLLASQGPQDRKLSPAEQKMLDDHIEEMKRQIAKYNMPEAAPNPFAQYAQAQPSAADANPFSQYAQPAPKDESMLDKAGKLVAKALNYQHGNLEAMGNAVTSFGSFFPAIAGTAVDTLDKVSNGQEVTRQGIDNRFGEIASGLTYHPKTEMGQKLSEPLNTVMEQMPAYAGIHGTIPHANTLPPRASFAAEAGRVPEATKPKAAEAAVEPPEVKWDKKRLSKKEIADLEKNAPSNFMPRDPFSQLKEWQEAPRTLPDNGSPAFDAIAENLGGDRVTPEARAKAAFADETQANRQAAMEAEMKKRVTLEQGARDLNKPDQFKQAIEKTDDHPAVQAAEKRVDKASETLIKAAEQNPEHAARVERELKALEEQADKTRVNVVKSQLDVKLAKDEIADLEQKVKEARDARRPFNPRGQGGAINPAVFKEGFEKLKKLVDGTWLRAFTDETGFHVHAIQDSKKVGHIDYDLLDPKGTRWNIIPSEGYLKDNAEKMKGVESFSTKVEPEHRGKGYASEMYKFAAELGNDVYASDARTADGRAVWKGMEEKGIAKYDHIPAGGRIRSPGNKQMGGLWMGEPKPRKPQMTPEQIDQKQQAARVAKMIPSKHLALDEFNVIRTPEEVVSLAPQAKDISKDLGQKSLGSGVNFHAIMSNNPLLKYLRTVSRDVRGNANKFSETYITHNEKGLSPLWTQMSEKERTTVIGKLMDGDMAENKLSEQKMNELGFSDKQKQFAQTFYEANNHLYDRWNEVRDELGMSPIDYREGHFPGVFMGSYKTLVLDGEKQVVGVLTGDTAAQLKIAKQHMLDSHDDVTFVDKGRQSIQGGTKRYYSDIFSGMQDVLRMLGENDPRFAEVKEITDKAMKDATNQLFNFNVHQLQKKGVVGNAGNKPWLSPEQNAKEAFQALVRYFEEGTMHHEMQVPLKNLRDLMDAPELEHMPNAKAYVEKYMNKMTGDDINMVGSAMNTIIDAPFKLIPNVSWSGTPNPFTGKRDFAGGIGVGAQVPLKMAGAAKNFMSQYFMGWGNYMFTAAQLMQPIQTGLPFMQLTATRLGLDATHIAQSMGKGGAQFNIGLAEKFMGKTIESMDPAMRAAMKYAEDRGLMTFSEIENAYQGTQGALSRAKDQIAEANMKAGEFFTRTPMFMSFVDMIHNKAGIDLQSAMPIAENLTQFAMIDYHQWERPMIYGQMGVVGQFAGGLTTFKHGYMSQEVKLGKEAISPTSLLTESGEYKKSQRQLAPFIMSALLGTMVFQGITGTPFYGELDQAYSAIREKMTGKYTSIREDFLKNSPEWLNTGMVSNATGMNMQGKFSSADMIPNDIPTALSPQLAAMAKIIGDAIDYAKLGDHVRARNLLTDLTPQAWKGIPEMAMRTDAEKADGFPRNKDGLKVGETPRTEGEWKARAVTGLRPQHEAVERETLWNNRKTDMADNKRRTEIEKEYIKRIEGGAKDNAPFLTLQQEYRLRGGDPKKLIDLAVKAYVDMQLNEKQRLEGIPNSSLPSVNRFQNYNR